MLARPSILALAGLLLIAAHSVSDAQSTSRFAVEAREIEDLKAVFATVRSKDRIEARVRTGGTVVSRKVDEGAQVDAGQVIAVVADPKIALKIKGLDAQIVGLDSRVVTAKADLDRAEQLKARGVTPQSRVDQLKTAFDVASNELTTARAERQVAEEQIAEGQVLAPARGRVLKVPVTDGSVVLPGESVATIAANAYLLRLELPERHARFMKVGDSVRIGARGLAVGQQAVREGRIIRVYPELEGGRVIADAEVSDLGDYFIGERAVAWLAAGRRTAMVVPSALVAKRFGLDLVRLAQDKGAAIEVVVQLGQSSTLADGSPGIEVLAGIKSGDVLLPIETAAATKPEVRR